MQAEAAGELIHTHPAQRAEREDPAAGARAELQRAFQGQTVWAEAAGALRLRPVPAQQATEALASLS